MKPYIKEAAIKALIFGAIMTILYVIGGILNFLGHQIVILDAIYYFLGCSILMFLFNLWDEKRKYKKSE